MKRPERWIAALILVAGAAPVAAAQDLTQLCQTVAQLTVGQWASYVATGGPMDGSTLRFAIVGSEQHNDSTFYWFELRHTSTNDPAHDGVIQALIPGWGVAGSPRGLIMKMGTQPATRMPAQLMAAGRTANPGSDMARHCATSSTIGWESVTVAAGSIRALHVKDTDGNEAWISSTVPFGLVLIKKPDGSQMALTGRGGDATSSITETPRDLPMIPGAPGP
ncbi:MAG TPA: hypothetical protein VN848_03705 [Gemmatimonadales bacterium]|nr:hypothetical protein [Gemmatimonadales bacterium]